MKRFIPVLVVFALGLWIGCDEDKGTDGNGDEVTPRLVADTAVSEPTLSSPHEAMWDSVASVTLDVSGGTPKLKPSEAAGRPLEIHVQAIKKGGKLYLRLQWSDLTFDAYPNYFEVYEIDIISFPPRVKFRQDPDPRTQEDQIFVMFDSLLEGGYDVWNWRVLTTGGGGLGKGYTYKDGALNVDAAGTASDSVVAYSNPSDGFGEPTFMSRDTSKFEGYILYLSDTARLTDTIRFEEDPEFPGDSVPITYRNTTGWELDQRVPGWLIDMSFASLSDEERGSRWDIKAVSDTVAGQYHLVLCRKLYTTFDDDIDLSAMNSVKVKIGIYDNEEEDFGTGSDDIGFSEDFWIILP